jgi:hypothetical protein
MTPRFYWSVIDILAVWRITHLFYAEDGPWNLLAKLRRAVGEGFWGGLLDCFYCLSLWVAIPAAWVLGMNWKERILLWPALSAGAILLERLTSRSGAAIDVSNHPEPQVSYSEDDYPEDVWKEKKENEHVLRQE